MLVAMWWCVNNWMHFYTFAHISNCWNDDTQMGWQAQSWWQLQSGGWWLLQHRGTLLAAKIGGGSVWGARRVYDASSSGGSQLYLSSIVQGWRGDEDVRVVRVSELSDTRLPHASPEWPQQRVGSCAAQYLLSTYLHIYISTHWVQSWGLACTIFYESLQKYVTSNNDIPISNVCSSDELIELCRYKCV